MTRSNPTVNQHDDRLAWSRRTMLGAMGWGGLRWMTPLADVLAGDTQGTPTKHAKSLIVLWLAGGPSQLETFDPHPGRAIAAGTSGTVTAAKGLLLAEGMETLAEQMGSVALVRNVVSREGDHERASYYGKSGYRPIPALTHPSIGAVVCHQLPVLSTEIPRHISILSDNWPARGGYLGNEHDAYVVGDPRDPVPDVQSHVESEHFRQRLNDLRHIESRFQQRYVNRPGVGFSSHARHAERAATMMSSDQLKAFDLNQVPRQELASFGDSPFGRGCLAAVQLIEVGVRCVEITLPGWDSHINNHEIHARLRGVLDPAFGSLIRTLRERELLDDTVVLCGGEFGRTPQLNPAGGRDHWPHGFSLALAGGPIRRGVAIGTTDPDGGQVPYDAGNSVADVHATVLRALGIDPALEVRTSVGRPMKLSDGKVIPELLDV